MREGRKRRKNRTSTPLREGERGEGGGDEGEKRIDLN